MINYSLVYPMFFVVIISAFVFLRMFSSRIRAVRSGAVDAKYFKTFSKNTPQELPEDVIKTQRHYINLFENPTLFYAGCITAMIIPVSGYGILLWAWLFALARLVHMMIHLGKNKLRPRMISFGLSWLALLGLWITIVVKLMAISYFG